VKLRAGDRIRLSRDDFERLTTAISAELGSKIRASRGPVSPRR
jgi:hypothetical protein